MERHDMESIIFNNSTGTSRAMKMSFSCSSLQRSADGLECQDHARIRVDRPYNSLTKKRKDPNQEYCQRTWINRDDCKDDFWAAIRSNYDYIMDTHLIDSCKEANGELIWDEGDVSTLSWGLKEVSCQFSELYTWLGVLQELVYSKEENLLDKSLRATHMEELQRKAYRRRLFNDQAAKLVARSPSLKDEVAWRVDHLNAKWELVEQIMAPAQPASDQDVSADFEHEVKCLRKWLREMESRLQPLSFRIDWTRSELEEKATEHMVLQKDIEAHGRIVSSVVKLSERVAKQQEAGDVDQDTDTSKNWQNREVVQAVRVAGSLERRWHLLFLRALEWQCHIETLASRLCNKSVGSCRCSSDSDEEPVIKQPRLSRRHCRENGRENTGRSGRMGPSRRLTSSKPRNREPGVSSSCQSDSDMSSGYHHNEDESYFEDDLEQLCVTETKCKVSRGPEKRDNTVQGDQGEEGDIEEGEASDDEMPPTLDPAMASVSGDEVDGTSSRHNSTVPDRKDTPKRRRTFDESSIFNTSDRKSKNCATFYFKHRDTDSEADCGTQESEMQNGIDDSSEEEWTYTALPTDDSATHEHVKTNVVVRLDFGEPGKVEKSDHVEFKRENIRNTTIEEMRILEEEEEAVRVKEDNGESEDETKNDIQKLILEVEKLVSEEGRKGVSTNLTPLILNDQGQTNYRAKYARIKEWLKLNSTHNLDERSNAQNWQPLDSCDASGEYTTGESDVEKQSVSSEDLHSSVATYRRCEGGLGCVSQSVSQEIYNDNEKTIANEGNNHADGTPKVVMRTKRKSDGKRPWSVSCVFGQLNTNNDTAISQFSISETALHQLVSSTPTKAVSLDSTSSRAPFNNSTSTLLEENGRVVRNSSIRKKKSRLRKKTLSRKSESGSDCMNANYSGGSDASSTQQRSNVRKSLENRGKCVPKNCHKCIVSYVTYGSTISCCLHHEGGDKGIITDPPPSIKLTCCTPEPTSSADTEEINRGRGNFEENLFDNVFKRNEVVSPINGDSDIEKNSIENTSFSEQAWDSYQEKYMSEPYSEAADVETARKLLEFGDDYRNFLDSQSDCASSLGAVRSCSSPIAGSRLPSDLRDSSEDSDSDTEDLRRVIDKSYKKLLVMESHFARANGLRATKDNMELEYVCKENIRCLQALIEPDRQRGEKSVKQVLGLTERWEDLSHKVEEAQRASVLQRELAAMHLEFRGAYERLTSHEVVLEPDHVLAKRINQITSELATLRERKTAMLALNVSAHRLITDLGAAATSVSVSLKDAVADLYRVWDEAFQRGNQQLCALQAVQQFLTRLTELQNALQRDKDTLAVLDAALQAGATSEVASSVRDVARLLSEKQDVNSQSALNEETLIEGITKQFPEPGVMSLGQEGGTFSDSGISDSGSEQELSERERRLAALRRLTRSLESQLAPGSDALMGLWKRVEDAEAELRSLQKQCRELIVRTAASVEAKVVNRNTQTKFTTSKRKKRLSSPSSDFLQKSKHIVAGDDPDDDPNLPKSWVWRILRAALPFQLAIVALLCAACLLEPHCCEAGNSLNLSLTPQLRYVRGPPPV
ncbi:klarsicht protein isoform X1 [Diachasmimorpha longicaudata]|uniref:klarsicht protein isoform X1 n=1 Tax=Diachasmimorpha longicaudata TaxID=58733 RepID=UPI0030B869F5